MPGDIGGKTASAERRPVQNLNDLIKTDSQTANPVTTTAAVQTEQPSQEEFEDDMEEGGLC